MSGDPKPCDCGCMGFGPVLRGLMQHMGPGDEARQHFRSARVEFLKGLRAVLDERIEQMSKPEAKGASVPVE
ncbi:MAG TPA: hypothetical protein DEH78_14390 [Solibacterales bacterium]|nr:hypothetical protein [Bryobacterales bacterium]